jgi:pimeloyl-ACP methyl ester carboxylesterase
MKRSRVQARTAHLVRIPAGAITLAGILEGVPGAQGIVLLAYGSDSRSSNPRTQAVAQAFRRSGLATVLFDMLTPLEAAIEMRTHRLRFAIEHLARRLIDATDWLALNPITSQLRIGYFATNTVVAAALLAAGDRPDSVGAIVSWGGRPDLAGGTLARVHAPTLLIVGQYDFPVSRMNRDALAFLGGVRQLAVIPGATHLFAEPPALEAATQLACQWLTRYLTSADEPELAQPYRERQREVGH